MLPEVKKKLITTGLILAAILGLLFVIFAVFLNRGQLVIKAKAPYAVEIQNLKSQACTQDECAIELAPGTYTAIVKKSGYRDEQISVNIPMAGNVRQEVQMQFVPILSLMGGDIGGSNGQDAQANATSVSAITATLQEPKIDRKNLPNVPMFFEDHYVVYLAVNPETRWQTLYARPLESAAGESPATTPNTTLSVGEPQLLTSFPRTLKEYVIVPAIEQHQAVAVIEQTDTESTLYMVDLQDQSRKALVTFPFITDVKWLPKAKDFLLSGWESGGAEPWVYLYQQSTGQPQRLDLKTPLSSIVPLSKDRLLVATRQQTTTAQSPQLLEGQLVTLSETLSQSSSAAASTQTANTSTTGGITVVDRRSLTEAENDVLLAPGAVNFVDYSLITNQARLLKNVPEFPLPQRMKLEGSGNSLLMLTAEGQVYRLQFAE